MDLHNFDLFGQDRFQKIFLICVKKTVLRRPEPGAGGAVIKLPLGTKAVTTNYGSGSLLCYQRLEEILII